MKFYVKVKGKINQLSLKFPKNTKFLCILLTVQYFPGCTICIMVYACQTGAFLQGVNRCNTLIHRNVLFSIDLSLDRCDTGLSIYSIWQEDNGTTIHLPPPPFRGPIPLIGAVNEGESDLGIGQFCMCPSYTVRTFF